ncbi:AraC family transcriptional regulator [Cryptosporangium phraense]|uniref:AraC family transcriptional regulator n=2 Tax=Cryptosporangium phraense TaxID=2593070 RepID=A0A545AIH2_9ACTN|nr:AraC family transcriptional regulator [Cryptosporangium phraense]
MAGFRERPAGAVDLQVIPYPAVTVIVDLGEGLQVDHDGGRESGAVVAGLAPGVLRGGGRDVECLQVRLSPVVAHAVLGVPSGAVVGLADLWGRSAARVSGRLRAARTWDERFAIVSAALGERAERGRAVDPEVAFAWRQLVGSGGRARIDELATRAGWGRQRLWSRFRAQIGLSPKRAAQLIRFDVAAHRLAGGASPAAVAAEGGYADQSHLHREARAFAGLTPAALAAAPWLAVDDVAWAYRR